MGLNLAVLPGDGAGPALRTQALNAVQVVGERFGHSFSLNEGLVGGAVRDTFGKALSYEALLMYGLSDMLGPNWRDEQYGITRSRIGEANNMELDPAALPGDGAERVVGTGSLNLLLAVSEECGDSLNFNEGLGGGVATDTPGKTLSYEMLRTVAGYAKAEMENRILANVPRSNWRGGQYRIC